MCTLVMNSGGTWSRGTNLHLPFDVNVMCGGVWGAQKFACPLTFTGITWKKECLIAG